MTVAFLPTVIARLVNVLLQVIILLPTGLMLLLLSFWFGRIW
jgi:hypothetical protein